MNGSLAPLLWFVGVVALIPVALWLLKRTPIGAAAASGPMRTVSALPLSASQRIVTIEVGSGDERLWLVLGVTPQSIRTLHTMAPHDPAPLAPATPQTTFAQLLQRVRPRGPDDHVR